MRVLMVSKACLVGTYQRKLEEIGKFDDVDLTVIIPPAWNDPAGPIFAERTHTDGYQLLIDPIRFNGSFHTHYYPRLKKRLQALKPDIVHIDEEPYNLATWLAWRQASQVGANPLFFSWQNINRQYPFPFSFFEKQVLGGVEFAIMGNQEAVSVWQAKGYRGKTAVIPQFGVDPELFKPAGPRDSGRGFIIGSANRRLVPEKGVDLLLKAAANLPGIWQLRIAGEGPEKVKLQQLAHRLGIQDRVQFEGAVTSSEMARFLPQLDVLVLASRTMPNWKEQFGRVLIEAMACGVPVIGSKSGEIPHVIGDGGLTFSEDDHEALTHHLVELMRHDSTRLTLGERGRARVLAHFTQTQIAQKTVEFYREMMGN